MTEGTTLELLTIDVDAEVRKLCGRQLASPTETVAELVRCLVGAGASEVRLTLGRRGATLVAPGAALPPGALEELARVRDPGLSHDERHRALVACEALGPGLLAWLTEPRGRLCSGAWELRLGPGGPRLRSLPGPGPLIVELVVAAAGADPALLARACRFAELPIFLGSRRVSGGLVLEGVLVAEAFVGDGCAGVVGLPRGDALCRTAMVRLGVVQVETTGVSPDGGAHLAVVRDDRARTAPELDRPRLGAAVRAVRERLYRQLSARFAELPPGDQRGARDLLFRRAWPGPGRGPAAPELVAELAIFRRLAGEPVTLAAVAEAAAQNDGLLWAVGEAERTNRPFLVERQRIFRLDERERAFVSDALGLALGEPPVRVPLRPLARAWGAVGRILGVVGRGLRSAAGRLGANRLIDSVDLTEPERRLVAALAAELASGRFLLPGVPQDHSRRTGVVVGRRGPLPPRTVQAAGQRALCLPRPALGPMAAALARDRALAYPILAALFCGFDGYGVRKAVLHEALLGERVHGLGPAAGAGPGV